MDGVVALKGQATLVCLVLATPLAASAQTDTATAAEEGFVGPAILSPVAIDYPQGADGRAAVVRVRIRVETSGEVSEVELLEGAGPPFDQLVVDAARRFRFSPARYQGVPVVADVNFTQRFVPPEDHHRQTEEPEPTATFSGRLEERGSRRSVPFASVEVQVRDVVTSTLSDASGRFELELPPGEARVTVTSPGFVPFVQSELLEASTKTRVLYLVEPLGTHPYEVIVRGQVIERIVEAKSLQGKELDQVPGTFGDPFRVVTTLPGVSLLNSVLPYPVVRGSSPGNTGFLIDGVRVPLLFHLLAGPSVVHPELIEEIAFHPGAFSVEYGGYTGGIVDGTTRNASPDQSLTDIDLNLFQAGGLVRRDLGAGIVGTVAGRYGYPGPLIGIASDRFTLSYWDYQARIDGGKRSSGYSVFFFGARDDLDAVPEGLPSFADKEPFLRFQFHRADLEYHHQGSGVHGRYQLTLGYDDSLSQEDASVEAFAATPRLRWDFELSKTLSLRTGLDGLVKLGEFIEGPTGGGEFGELVGINGAPSAELYSGGVLAELVFAPTEDIRVQPGVRTDGYANGSETLGAVDPRLLLRYRIVDEGPAVWLKGGAGLFHQPARFTVPIPGLDQIAFEQGLLESIQTSAGAEIEWSNRWTVDLTGYFHWMDPILYDLQLNEPTEAVATQPPPFFPGQLPTSPITAREDLIDRLDEILQSSTGRAYGAELLLRRSAPDGPSGWISYTLSRTERLQDEGWVGFDFDRTHILSAVALLPLPRRWQIGLRGQLLSGRPITTTRGLSTARTEPFIRFDLRVDKTVVFNDWFFDFYVDISNVVVASEEIAPQNTFRYVLPTIGVRAIL